MRAKMRKMREDHEDEEMENGELNLVPYLDIVTNVIMFLMMTTSFAAALADINVTSPTAGVTSGGATDQPKQDLNLTLQVSDKGYTIAASGAVLYEGDVVGKLPTIPKKGNDYDRDGLTKKMRQIKDQFPDETKLIINANPEITYENVVAAMDSCRNDGPKVMFNDVLLSAGVN
jgi:biopolymer transport protein ExbD